MTIKLVQSNFSFCAAMRISPFAFTTLLRALFLGVAFGVALFCIGFILGVPRTVLLVPLVGREMAIAIELPLMFAIAWVMSAHFSRAWHIDPRWQSRLALALAALIVGMSCEVGLGMIWGENSFVGVMTEMFAPANRVGLMGQVIVFFIPLVQIWTPRK